MSSLSRSATTRLLIFSGCLAVCASTAAAQMTHFSKKLDRHQVDCLKRLWHASRWKYLPESYSEMMKITQVKTAMLNDRERPDYIYLFEDDGWCGTAGCPLLIGESQRDGNCRLLYDDMGDASFTVLRRRDHGYRRIYAPCEARFDGHQYQQLHEECPNLEVHH